MRRNEGAARLIFQPAIAKVLLLLLLVCFEHFCFVLSMSGNIGRLFVGKASSAKYVCCCVLNGNVLCTRMLLKNYCSEIRSCSVKNLYRRTLLNCAKFMEFCHHANGRVKIAAVAPGAEVL